MTGKQIADALINGEDFNLFNNNYRFASKPVADGIYHYRLVDAEGKHKGMARFNNRYTKVLLAFSYGRFSINLKNFVKSERNNSPTWGRDTEGVAAGLRSF